MFEKAKTFLFGSSAAVVEKRAGLYVSRPVMNADAWAKWAVAAGIPNPVDAADLHVTIIASRVPIQAIPDGSSLPVYVGPNNAVFVGMGPEGKALAICFDDWSLRSRFWSLLDLGAVSDWPSMKPHVTLSYDAAGYDIPTDAFVSMPPSLMFGPEAIGDFRPVGDADEDEDPGEVDSPTEEEAEKARALMSRLLDSPDLDVFEKMALRDAAERRPMEKSTLTDLRAALNGGNIVGYTQPSTVEFFTKAADKMQIVYGWANNATIGGEEVVDCQDDAMTVKALHQYTHALLTGPNTVNVEHEKDASGEYIVSGTVVEGLVMDATMQSSLETCCKSCGNKGPVDLGREGVILGMFVPDKGLYDKTGPGQEYPQLSIGALPIIEENT